MEENLLPPSEAAPPEFELALWMDLTAGATAVSAWNGEFWIQVNLNPKFRMAFFLCITSSLLVYLAKVNLKKSTLPTDLGLKRLYTGLQNNSQPSSHRVYLT